MARDRDAPRREFVDPLVVRAEGVLSVALSKLLNTHPDTAQRLASLDGAVIELALRDTARSVFAFPGPDGVRLKRRHDGVVAVKVSGRLSDFLAYARASRRGETLGAGRIEIMGDLAVAQRVQGLLAELQIDWEELLSRFIGDVPAHQFGRVARAVLALGREALTKFERDGGDYLTREIRLVVRRDEIERFARDAFRLADDVDRLEARMRLLAERRERQ